ncbi:hypothetical protein FLM55_00980 [Francisella sp. Scap27]|uniref:hypothetical protein n=1 Tax=Francisella sp. Scap27 TaxID=2589986 RepID=UPI0015BED1BA|nr:hypothetical protein [Francisella sp. Scap27]QLE78385.1 hypothetical protein FLM55_00980 [Francisella sp. Scap27]
MLDINKIYHKYIDQDPIKVLQDGAIKASLIFFVFLSVATYLDFDRNLIVISILFIANLAASVLIGSIEAKRLAFFLYMLIAIIMINLSPLVHPAFEDDFMLIILIAFFAFWSRRFGPAFAFFPIMITVLTCICFVRFPLDKDNHLTFTVTAVIIGLAFYILLIRSYKPMTDEEIKKVILDFSKLFVRNTFETFEKASYRRFTQSKVYEANRSKFKNIVVLQDHGLMFLKKAKHEKWRYFCYNIALLNRLIAKFILNYKRLSNNHIKIGFNDHKEVENLLKNLETIFKKTLFLFLYSQRANTDMARKLDELDHLKYKFEINYIEKYHLDELKKPILFDSVLLLDDMFINVKNLKEAYDDLCEG